jgi:hypothetical protein
VKFGGRGGSLLIIVDELWCVQTQNLAAFTLREDAAELTLFGQNDLYRIGRLQFTVVHVKVYNIYITNCTWKNFLFAEYLKDKKCKFWYQFLTWCSVGGVSILNGLAAACFLQWDVQIAKKAYIFTFLLTVWHCLSLIT